MRARALIGLACLAPLLSVGQAADAGKTRPSVVVRGGVTQPAFSYKQAIRETVYVRSTMDQDADGDLDLLATDIIRPRETDRGLKVPVIYEMSPYYQALGRGNESETKRAEDGDFSPEVFPLFYDNYFVPRGYAVVLQDMRGTRNSEGCMVLGDREELLDAKATIDWLNGRGKAFDAEGNEVRATWSTGSVGMIGKSYDGTIANGAATTGVEGLKTIVPIAAISRWYDYHLNNGVQYYNAYLTPGLFSFVIDQTAADDEERGAEWVEATFGEYGPCTAVGAQVVAEAADPVADYDAFWDGRDYLKDAGKVEASVLLVHGLNDYNVKPNHYVQWWDALTRQGVPRKIWLAQVGHVDPFDFRRSKWVDTLHRWFDHWLHGLDNGIMDEPMADVEVAPGRWQTRRRWPASSARPVRLHLGPSSRGLPGTLSFEPAPKGATQSYIDDAFQDESSMADDPRETRSTRLLFLSQRLRRDVRISGRIRVDIRAAVDRPDTNFTALLVDYGEGDRWPMVDYGSGDGVRTTTKRTCHGAGTPADDGCYYEVEKIVRNVTREIVTVGYLDGRHRESLRSNTPLVPGSVYRFGWELFGDDYTFAKGHRIGLVIAGSSSSTVRDPFAASVHVHLRGSTISLPIAGGRSGAAAAL